MVASNEFGHQPDPVVLELNKLHNMLKGSLIFSLLCFCIFASIFKNITWRMIAEKDRELGFAQSEIKALKSADVMKEKSLKEVQEHVNQI